MSQDWVADLYTTGTVGHTTLTNMELMFATLRSSFSGGTAPSNAVDGNLYYDTGTDLLKLYRNAAWAGVLVGSVAFKMWVYLNAAEDGWTIDAASVTDRVLAFKGGSTYVTAGANAGTWTISGLARAAHTHVAGTLVGASHTHNVGDSGWPKSAGGPDGGDNVIFESDTSVQNLDKQSGGKATGGPSASGITGSTGAQSNPTITADGAWRVAGAVGTLQFPDMT